MGQELTEIGWLKNGSNRLLRQWKTIEFEQPRPESGADVAAVPSSVTQSYYTRCTMARIWVVVSLLPLLGHQRGCNSSSCSKSLRYPLHLFFYQSTLSSFLSIFFFFLSFYLFSFLFSFFFFFRCWFKGGRIDWYILKSN